MRRGKATPCYHGRGRIGTIALLAGAGLCFLMALVCAFALPGVRFSAVLFSCAGAVLIGWLILNRWAQNSRIGKVCRAIFIVLLAVGIVAFAAVEGILIHAGEHQNCEEKPVAAIVLGAGVNGNHPSLVLQSRIDAAAAYLTAHPDIPAILSGGQGPGESISEAQAMYCGLVEKGIEAQRLYVEEQSTNTAENFANSSELLRELKIDFDTESVAVVTSDFHLFRAELLAKRQGLRICGVPAQVSWWWLNANYYAREAFALVKALWI